MLNLSLAAVERGEVRLREEIPADHPLWEGFVAPLVGPAHVELLARPVGSGGVLVTGEVGAELEFSCRRCLAPARRTVREEVEIYLRPAEERGDEDDAESYFLDPGAAEVSLADPVREQLLLELPEFVECSEECRGLCPQCGADLNRGDCSCEPERDPGPWDALRKLKFD
jgi:uncharacterized protein